MSQLRKRQGLIGGVESAGTNEWAQTEIDEALAELDRMTRQFAGGVSELGGALDGVSEPATTGGATNAVTPSEQELMIGGATLEQVSDPLETRMAAAEEEARRYLDQAKGRADKLVQSMLEAVEREAEQIRHETEQRINARFERAEAQAGQYVARAQEISEEMVADRQQRIAELSDGITMGAGTLTVGMEDANRVQGQFEGFVLALSKTASKIAESSTRPGSHLQALGTLSGVERESTFTGRIAA